MELFFLAERVMHQQDQVHLLGSFIDAEDRDVTAHFKYFPKISVSLTDAFFLLVALLLLLLFHIFGVSGEVDVISRLLGVVALCNLHPK